MVLSFLYGNNSVCEEFLLVNQFAGGLPIRPFAKNPFAFDCDWGFQPQAVVGESCPISPHKLTNFWQMV